MYLFEGIHHVDFAVFVLPVFGKKHLVKRGCDGAHLLFAIGFFFDLECFLNLRADSSFLLLRRAREKGFGARSSIWVCRSIFANLAVLGRCFEWPDGPLRPRLKSALH